MKKTALIFATVAALSSTAYAADKMIDINVNSDDLEVQFNGTKKWSRDSKTIFRGGFLKSYDDRRDESDVIANGGVVHYGYTDVKGLEFGIGLNGVTGTIENGRKDRDVLALGLRMQLSYVLPFKLKTVVSGIVNYAPRALCFADKMEKYQDYRLELAAEVINGGWLYAGIRDVAFGYEDLKDDYTFNDNAYVGFRFHF